MGDADRIGLSLYRGYRHFSRLRDQDSEFIGCSRSCYS